MTISYNEFMRLVPEETKEYVKNVLSNLYYFINKENIVRDKEDIKEYYRDNYTKMVASCIIALDNTKYKDFLIQRGYKNISCMASLPSAQCCTQLIEGYSRRWSRPKVPHSALCR